MTWRRLSVILAHLPAESEYKTEVINTIDLTAVPEPAPGVFGPWSQGDVLLARVGDLLERWLWMNADQQSRPKQPPEPFPRPGVTPRAKVLPISPGALAYLEYVRDHNGAAPPDDWKPAMA